MKIQKSGKKSIKAKIRKMEGKVSLTQQFWACPKGFYNKRGRGKIKNEFRQLIKRTVTS